MAMGDETRVAVEERKVPKRALCFRDTESVVEVRPGEGDAAPRFSMIANSGQPFAHWYWDKIIIDIEGAQVLKQIPILFQHDTDQVVGYTDTVEKKQGGLYLEGPILPDEEAAAMVLRRSKQNFPWQASVYVVPESIQVLDEGEFAMVNGMKFEGPGAIFWKGHIRESSFCVLGADEQTSAEAYKDGDDVAVKIFKTPPQPPPQCGGGDSERLNGSAQGGLKLSEGERNAMGNEHKDQTNSAVQTSAAAAAAAAEPLKFTAEMVAERAPEVAEKFRAEGAAEAVKAERERCATLFADTFALVNQCGTPEARKKFSDIAAEAVKAGSSNDETRQTLLSKMSEIQFATQPENPGSQAPSNPGDKFAGKSGEDLWKAQFADSAEIRREFGTESCYLAFKRHEEKGDFEVVSFKAAK